jgi:hypothetical protein
MKYPHQAERGIFSKKPSSGRKRYFKNSIIKGMEVNFKNYFKYPKGPMGTTL